MCFHGINIPKGVAAIFRGDLKLLKAGDLTVDLERVGVRPGYIHRLFMRVNKHTGAQELFDPNQIYTSFSPVFVSDKVNAATAEVPHPCGIFILIYSYSDCTI